MGRERNREGGWRGERERGGGGGGGREADRQTETERVENIYDSSK